MRNELQPDPVLRHDFSGKEKMPKPIDHNKAQRILRLVGGGNNRISMESPGRTRQRGLGVLVTAAAVTTAATVLAIGNATESERVCVNTNGAATEWDNGEEAVRKLRIEGIDIPDQREIIDPIANETAVDGTKPVRVCVDQPTGIVGKIIDGIAYYPMNTSVTSVE